MTLPYINPGDPVASQPINDIIDHLPRGVRASGFVAPNYTLTAGGAIAPGSVGPTEPNRLYEAFAIEYGMSAEGFTAGLAIVTFQVGGTSVSVAHHIPVTVAFGGFMSWAAFHSGPGGHGVQLFLRTSSTMTTGSNGVRIVLLDRGHSDSPIVQGA